MSGKPAITAPVMRVIGVVDRPRSVAFYRDVLGFEIRERDGDAEAVYGPACLRFGAHDYPPTDWEHPQPPGSAMVFFETNDLDTMHAVIVARGGNPSGVEKVNWVKMRMFQIHDPDGHTLWFGQSYHQADRPLDGHMLEQIMPELPLNNVSAGVVYYRDVLGFQVNYEQHDLAVMDRDHVRLLLIARTQRHKGIGSASFYIQDADKFYAELRAKGATTQGEPASQPWGLRTFRVLDPEDNELNFGQPFE